MIINPALYKKGTDLPPSVPQAVPEISVSPSGKITATATQTAGMVTGGTVTAEKQLPTRSGGTVPPSKAAQTVAEAGELLTGDLVVEEIPEEYIVPTGSKEITENGSHDVREVETVVVDVASTGADTSDATATASDVFLGETFYGAGGKATGSFTIDSELSEQDALITDLEALANSLGSSGGGGGDIDALIDGTITDVESNAESVRDYCLYYSSTIKSVRLPKATSIGKYAFQASSLEEIYCPEVLTMGNGVFNTCRKLTKAKIPLLSTLPSSTFRTSNALLTVDLPMVTYITEYSFRDCSALKALILRSETICVAQTSTTTFQSSGIANGTGYVYVPRALVESYKVATNWSTYAAQFRALEDYTVDGTITGELDETKI